MDIRPGCTMAPHVAPDVELVARAREGDRVAFGVLYLRHHASAWRLASAMSGFSDDAELAVLAGFTDVFSILPRRGDPSFRAHLLHSVRRAALERRRTRRHDSAAGPPGHPRDTNSVSAMRRALANLPETGRATLWLTDVEAMTPAEVASVVGVDARAVPRLAGEARARIRATCADAPLAAAAAPPPMLGGECQRYWLTRQLEKEARPAPLPGRRPRRDTRRSAPLTALATTAAALFFGLPLGPSEPPDRPTTVAVSPAVRAYLPGSASR